MTLKEAIMQAKETKQGLGHFNFSNLEGFLAIVEAAKETGRPVLLGLSEGERKYVGAKVARAMVDAIKKETGLDIFLNADHVHSLASAEEALAAGFDSVTFDRGELPLEQNIAETKAVVDLARQQYPGVLIEGELGFIGHSSEIIAEVPTGAAVAGDDLTTVADAVRFATETGIDLLAPAVGNIHGIVTAGEPQLDLTRLAEISQATGLPLVLHGGSGNTEADLAGAVAAGATIVHINTEMRRAWRAGLEAGLVASPTELAPYKLSSQAVEQMQAVIMAKIKLFRCA